MGSKTKEKLSFDKSDDQLHSDLIGFKSVNQIYLVGMLIVLVMTFGVMIYKLIGTTDLWLVSAFVAIIFLVIAAMHKIWRDSWRSRSLLGILPFLSKEDRVKVVEQVLNDDKEIDFNKLWVNAKKTAAPLDAEKG
jgi:hypothetical protein